MSACSETASSAAAALERLGYVYDGSARGKKDEVYIIRLDRPDWIDHARKGYPNLKDENALMTAYLRGMSQDCQTVPGSIGRLLPSIYTRPLAWVDKEAVLLAEKEALYETRRQEKLSQYEGVENVGIF